MSASVNKVILLGRLGKDPEVRYTQAGMAVANFSLATDESYTDKAGEKQKKTEWMNIVVWGKTAENFVQPYLHKGDLVYIEGKLQTRSWEKDGEKKYTTEVVVLDIKGVQTGGDGPANAKPQQRGTAAGHSAATSRNDAPRGGQPAAQARTTGRPAPAAAPEQNDEDIPF